MWGALAFSRCRGRVSLPVAPRAREYVVMFRAAF
jgi:hypothetical protein